jgi:hypothetical protein
MERLDVLAGAAAATDVTGGPGDVSVEKPAEDAADTALDAGVGPGVPMTNAPAASDCGRGMEESAEPEGIVGSSCSRCTRTFGSGGMPELETGPGPEPEAGADAAPGVTGVTGE